MSENLSEAFIILIVGMITVFTILALVVLTGQILIRITNRFAPLPIAKDSTNPSLVQPVTSAPLTTSQNKTFNKKKLAVIIGAVEHLTHGKGKIKKIERIN